MSSKTEEYDVIIIGSGMSGLGAARVLLFEGYKILVLEGRDRPGGRVYTKTFSAVKDCPPMDVDLGANYLIGCSYKATAQPLLTLAKEANVETVTCVGDLISKFGGWECPDIGQWKNHRTGENIPMELVFAMSHLNDVSSSLAYAKYIKLSEGARKRWENETGYWNSVTEVLELYYMNGLRKNNRLSDLEREVLEAIVSRMITYQSPMNQLPINTIRDGATAKCKNNKFFEVRVLNPEDLDLWTQNNIMRLNAMKDNPPSVTTKALNNGEDRLVTNRFSNFIDYLALGVPLRYNETVRKIDYSSPSGSVSVTTVHTVSKAISHFRSKHCLVTVPVGVLARLHSTTCINFTPPLPAEKTASIKRLALPHLGAETHNKIVLRYHPSQVFWDPAAPHLKTNDALIHILNFHCYGKPGLLVCHVWGGAGIQTKDFTDEQLVAKVTALLQGMFQSHPQYKVLPRPIQTHVTRWSEDPFSLGSYTPGGRDSGEQDRNLYAQSIHDPKTGRPVLLFAGEGTLGDADAQECTHGALLSGMKRAAEVVQHHRPRRVVCLDKPSVYLKHRLQHQKSVSAAMTSFIENNEDNDQNRPQEKVYHEASVCKKRKL